MAKESPMTEAEMTAELKEQGFLEQEITSKRGVRGTEQRNAEGKVILSDEHYENGDRQVIQIEHGQPPEGANSAQAPSKEFGKLYTKTAEGEPVEKMLVREHPRTRHSFTLKGVSQDGAHLDVYVDPVLENLGHTVGVKDDNWSHFILEGAEAEKAFKGVKAPEGEKCRKLVGDFGSHKLVMDGRKIDFNTFGQVSLDYDDEGKVTRATIHCRDWEEKV